MKKIRKMKSLTYERILEIKKKQHKAARRFSISVRPKEDHIDINRYC